MSGDGAPGRFDDLAGELGAALGRPVGRDVPLSQCSTYRLGGPAALLADLSSGAELAAVAGVLARHPVPVLVVGRGSNLLVSDRGFAGLAVRLLGAFEELHVGDGAVRAGGGLPLPVLARRTAGDGRAGLEFYVGIPGSVGGAVRMNAGGHGRDTSEVLRRAWVVDLAGHRTSGAAAEEERTPASLGLGYRRSALTPSQVVTAAELAVVPDDPEACQRRVDEVVRWRRAHQPGGSNAGSVFTNPPGDSAGRLIDDCGLKGLRVGGAEVSPKHANFFQADRTATASDVHALVREVQRRVEERTGVRLLPEITFVGFGAGESA